ncbi:MFS transporter [Mesorhizobium sp. UC74_2]|uniref:MFS transporter n=1 Tax=Mesorhizobium sp. UC74_2 TaxID=3350171 RepID=UPI00366D89FE
MSPSNRWLVLAIVSSALFLIVIDMTVLYTALPTLTHELRATATEKLWIINAYPLVVAGLLPGVGTLGDRLGHKRMFLAGLVVFGLASLGAAFSQAPAWLIAARALLAVGAAMMMPATLSLIRLTFMDEKERAFAIGVWAAVASGGAAFGPVVGGALLEHFWWGSVFLINVPVVLVALLAGATLLPNRPGNSDHPWDLIGSIQVMIGLVGLTYAIKEIAKRDPSWPTAALTFTVGLITIVVFVRRQLASRTPLIDFSLFTNARFSAGVATAMVASAALIGVELVFSQRLQLVLGLSPLQAGLIILPIPLAAFVAGPLTGLALPRIGATRVLWSSLFLAGAMLVAYLLRLPWRNLAVAHRAVADGLRLRRGNDGGVQRHHAVGAGGTRRHGGFDRGGLVRAWRRARHCLSRLADVRALHLCPGVAAGHCGAGGRQPGRGFADRREIGAGRSRCADGTCRYGLRSGLFRRHRGRGNAAGRRQPGHLAADCGGVRDGTFSSPFGRRGLPQFTTRLASGRSSEKAGMAMSNCSPRALRIV